MEINPFAAASADNPYGQSQSTQNLPADPGLGMFDFLKLLTVQMTSQDPLNPMEDSDFIAQMAQFSSLQEMSKMNQQMTSLQSLNQWTNSQQLIGQEVGFIDEGGDEQAGIVSGIRREGPDTFLLINGNYVPFTSVYSVLSSSKESTHQQ